MNLRFWRVCLGDDQMYEIARMMILGFLMKDFY